MPARMNLADHARPFLTYLDEWFSTLQDVPLANIVAGEPERVAVLAIDVINGFCKSGPLASERVGQIAHPVADLLECAYALGVRNFALTQDAHDPQTPEFEAYPPHCIAGSAESDTVEELKALPFFSDMAVFPKNSISSMIGTGLSDWIGARPQIDRFIVVGDCTDLCTYQGAMHLRMEANAHGIRRRVIVPANAVDTFDTPVSAARELHIKAHDGDLHHVLFLHHMAMNGIEVVRALV